MTKPLLTRLLSIGPLTAHMDSALFHRAAVNTSLSVGSEK